MTMNVQNFLSEAGPVAKRLDHFELRPQQVEMAAAVENAFNTSRHLIVEAGTGVGKSFAYLIPAIQQVVQNGKRVLISTGTISLQEQLIQKDIPFLHAISGEEFSAVLCKGRSNYFCMRRAEQASKKVYSLFSDSKLVDDLYMIEDWAQHTKDGSLSDLPRQPAWQVWDKVCAEHGNCLGRRCKYYDPCFYQASRRRIANGQILVCNHAMFFSDLALRRAGASMLPDYDFVILDEAHTIEAVASDHFGISLSEFSVRHLLASLHVERTGRGFLSTLLNADPLAAIQGVGQVNHACDQMFEELDRWMKNSAPKNGRIKEKKIVENHLAVAMADLVKSLKAIQTQLNVKAGEKKLLPVLDNSPEGSHDPEAYELDKDRFELGSYIQRCNAIAVSAQALCDQELPDSVYWLESTGRTTRRLTWTCSPINVAAHLKANLFDGKATVVLTSATLATATKAKESKVKKTKQSRAATPPVDAESEAVFPRSPFAYFRSRIGLDKGDELQLGSPFDYETQMTLYLETALPLPDDPAFLAQAMDRTMHYIRQTQGRAFVLFTSYSMLDRAAAILGPELAALGYPLLAQGKDLTRSQLLDRFKRQDHSVLLGTDSFWQGVDVQGEALSNVIITKLPFAVPDKPLIESRLESIRDEGGNPFNEYSLPEAIIKFKQGFGRLIRSKSDRGIVVVLDKRLATKSYGKQFLAALPPCRVERVTV
jgi:ATP-dependent DNA helicase DinG